MDAAHEIPPTNLVAGGTYRTPPYLYSADEITALMAAARRMRPPLRAAGFETLIGLMGATGLRPGEAYRLNRGDVDLAGGVLAIRDSKCHKDRMVPIHASVVRALSAYARRRDELCPSPSTQAFLVSVTGDRLKGPAVCKPFAGLVAEAGIVPSPSRRRPRLSDLRHSFAVATLVDWYGQGADVQRRLPVLSTYMGHLNPQHTYWYLEACPELMSVAARRLEAFLGDLP